jgi:hypothetical protein
MVHVRINDAATGRPTPVRIRFLPDDGSRPVPLGRLGSFSLARGEDLGGHLYLDGQTFFFIDGTCEVRLPPGGLRVEASKGPEYKSLEQDTVLAPGQVSLRLTVERRTDLRKQAWFSGDTRSLYLTPHAALLEAAAEDLDVVNLLAFEDPPRGNHPARLPNLLAFSGTETSLQSPGHLVVVNTLNVHPFLGSVALLNSHRAVYPLRSGDLDSTENWSVLAWCEQCHRKKGLVVWPDLPRLTRECPQAEALAAAILGQIDAWEITELPDADWSNLEAWYELLDCNLRLALVGGSGKDSNTVALGQVRTYAQLVSEEPLTYAAWVEAVRKMRTVATTGTFLKLLVNGQGPGSVLDMQGANSIPVLRIQVEADEPGELELVVNHRVHADAERSLEREMTLNEGGWIAARWRSRQGDLFAHTSPIYVPCASGPWRPARSRLNRLLDRLQTAQRWVGQSVWGTQHAQEVEQVLQPAYQRLRDWLAQEQAS